MPSSVDKKGQALTGAEVIAYHQQCLALPRWPAAGLAPDGHALTQVPAPDADNAVLLWHWVGNNHRFNSLLWDEEDLARRTRVSAEEIAANKRAIDGYNQARNDATERVDELLLLALGLVDPASARGDAPRSLANPDARMNSETAGSMIDRMSIMALKVRAMRAQTVREDVDEAHRAASRARLARLEAQRDDLGHCLDELLADCRAGRAYFKVYRQFKMYNDPAFNPALVAERGV
ncbi:MAG: DUF4254 domain-containing protein [Lautropia sp.]|nr:DUF4254 domain-containing protein [Lautropia sp.]